MSKKEPGATTAAGRFGIVRTLRGSTITEVADQLQVHPATVSAWESGQRVPSPVYRKLIESLLGVPAGLWERDSERQTHKQDQRFQVRCKLEEKEALKKAAAVSRESLSHFVLTAALERARALAGDGSRTRKV